MPLSGTIIICDQVYPTSGGKYVLAGTYTALEVHVRDLRRIDFRLQPLNAYVRVRPETTGPLKLQVRLRDEQQPPWEAPMVTINLEAQIDARTIRLFECPVTIPPFGIQVTGGDHAASAGRLELRYAVELLHQGELITSAPLDLRFIAAAVEPRAGT